MPTSAGDPAHDVTTTARESPPGQLTPASGATGRSDDLREVDFAGFLDGLVILPDATVDDTDAGWGERPESNDRRLLEERPPHW